MKDAVLKRLNFIQRKAMMQINVRNKIQKANEKEDIMVTNGKSLFMTVSELALLFGWKRNFIHRGIIAGRIPAKAEGQRYFIPRVWADRYYLDSVKGLDL